MNTNLFRNKVVVITGASKGLGKALAIELALSKADVVLVGRKKDSLIKIVKEIEQLKKKTGRLFVVSGDISTKEGCDLLIRDIKKASGNFDILINNASNFSIGKFEDEKVENIKKIIDTNVTGTITFTKLALPILKLSKKPGIINISGFAGKVALPYLSLFTATKFAITGFSEALQREYAGDSLKIMTVYPAGIKTETTQEFAPKFEKIGFTYDKPEDIANKIIEAYNSLRKELVLGKKERSLSFWNGFNKNSVDNKFKNLKQKISSIVAAIQK
ncbi:MAG: hypothetical protein A2086_07665 [Spirochaetes bacterium GWD1_27_9]|nr:MAG: hypothetical protein A2Z98_10300 [Spirochaetes bacterium GWB1_27_13]OHD25461.1 MAG: hypothetical protein A2Y34_17750 [Spirochaetes bacterium GWC1_27_15]OHD43343.1 MAG: hypothetical protein A2086_07665 [Spirochaetes bacterium GWD1_27_9]